MHRIWIFSGAGPYSPGGHQISGSLDHLKNSPFQPGAGWGVEFRENSMFVLKFFPMKLPCPAYGTKEKFHKTLILASLRWSCNNLSTYFSLHYFSNFSPLYPLYVLIEQQRREYTVEQSSFFPNFRRPPPALLAFFCGNFRSSREAFFKSTWPERSGEYVEQVWDQRQTIHHGCGASITFY